ncbi:GTPase ObgE [Rickettsiales bacterium]|nr:GTPase ObgE [Rickettsiales bacterium]
MKFLDEAKIYIKAGNGGCGCVSFRREKNVERGGPDGGDGGNGGYVYVKSYHNLNTLIDFRYQQHFLAKPGKDGSGRKKSGSNGDSLVIKVPVGTQILNENKEHIYKDFKSSGESYLIAEGGDGGRGNFRFKSSTNRAPRRFESGRIGEEKWVWLKLKLIADVGLVGLPNAGKSSLLKILSNASPKVADYAFTTLKPQLGLLRHYNKDIVIADLPGLIQGASEGVGLGHKFLAHIERCKLIIHLCDFSCSNKLIIENYKLIRKELEKYGEVTGKKKEVFVLNKSDLVSKEETLEKINIFKKFSGSQPILISCVDNSGIVELIDLLYETVK